MVSSVLFFASLFTATSLLKKSIRNFHFVSFREILSFSFLFLIPNFLSLFLHRSRPSKWCHGCLIKGINLSLCYLIDETCFSNRKDVKKAHFSWIYQLLLKYSVFTIRKQWQSAIIICVRHDQMIKKWMIVQ